MNNMPFFRKNMQAEEAEDKGVNSLGGLVPLLLSQSDSEGGAGQAAYRLYRGLRNAGVSATLKVDKALRGDSEVIAPSTKWSRLLALLWPHLDELPVAAYRSRTNSLWSTGLMPSRMAAYVQRASFDIAHLHWVNGGALSTREIGRINAPVVWTLHDSWAFTGGCHYPYDCRGYEASCGRCPQLGSHSKRDLSGWLWQHKKAKWRNASFRVVTPSRWLADAASASTLLSGHKIDVLPNGLDIDVFKPLDKTHVRTLLNLPADKTLILFGSVNAVTDKRKGFAQLKQALEVLAGSGIRSDSVELLIFGSRGLSSKNALPFKTHYLGPIRDEFLMAAVYAAADVFVLPSLADNLPYTIMEALACGTPCVAFNVGGIPEMIDHKANGYLASINDAADLADGIQFVISNESVRNQLALNARAGALQKYDIRLVARAHLSLYQEMVEQWNNSHQV